MGNCLIFNFSTELIRVPIETVAFISASGNYSNIRLVDGNEYMVTIQLGKMEERIGAMVDRNDNRFIRIGKSLIVNRDYITFINPTRQKIILSDCKTFNHELSASKEALKALKDIIDKENLR